MPYRRLGSWVLSALLLTTWAAPALSQEKSAQDLQKEAKDALGRGEIPQACVLFEQAYQASTKAPPDDPGPKPMELLFDLADCHEQQGYGSLAASEFEKVAESGGTKAADAKARAAKLRGVPAPADPPKDPPKDPPVDPAKPEGPVGDAKVEGKGEKVVVAVSEEAPTRIGDFMDTRLTWVFGDDDVLKQTGQAFPLSPLPSVGDRRQYRMFFDNLNSRFAGRENLTHLALYKKMPGFIKDLDTEASMLLRIDLASLASNSGNVNQAFYDAGSYIRAFYHTARYDDPKKVEGLGFTLWPIDTDRFRLGYLYDLSWGGTAAGINQSIFPRIVGSAPGAKFSYEHPLFSAYIGFKTAQIVQVEETLTPGTSEVEQIRIGQTNYGLLAGVSAQPQKNFHFDIGGGFFTQGKFDLPDVEGRAVWTGGAAARVVVHHEDAAVGQSIDFALYRNDPNKPQIIFRPEKYYPDKVLWQVSLEGDALFQRLKDFDVTGELTVQPAIAAALQGQLKIGFFRASLTGIFRDLPYVLRNQPSFIPFQSIPSEAETAPEFFAALAADYYIEAARLTPGVGAGLQLPSTFTSTSTDLSSAPISRTVVVRDQGNIAILPVNTGVTPIIQARASLKWDLSPIMSTIFWVQYVRDNNATFVERDPNEGTVALRTFVAPDFFGLGLAAQARF
ncbi:MAG: hypothetical protein IPM79_16310 [Polyangiaceae bacterium]|jgi:hypothetical protein|nr:hypothetical protein [Polyangiaceae bacterium]